MNLIECFLTTQQEKQKVGQGRWKDCLGIWNSSGETWETGIPNIPECQSRALLFRYKDWVWKLSFCCPSTTVHPITELRLTHSKLHPIGLYLWQGLPGPTSLSPLLLLLLCDWAWAPDFASSQAGLILPPAPPGDWAPDAWLVLTANSPLWLTFFFTFY